MANFFNRIGRVEILSGQKIIFSTGDATATFNLMGDSMRSLDGIDFKFSCKKVHDLATCESNAKVSIIGLSRETIQFLATYRPTGIERQAQKRVRIYASYEDFGDNLIFDGDVTVANPSVPPNNWLSIEAFVGNYRHQELYSGSINGQLTVKELIENTAKVLDLKTNYKLNGDDEENKELQRKLSGFDCSGTKADLLNMLNRVSDFIVYEDNGVLNIALFRDDSVRSRNTVAILSEDNGMVGVPQVITGSLDNSNGVGSVMRLNVKSFINPSIQLWDQVFLRSVYLPSANGYYTVNQIEYNGHLRGNSWFQTMQLTNANVGRT